MFTSRVTIKKKPHIAVRLSFFVGGTELRSFQFRKDLAIIADASLIERL
jgi:hypothetical protein